MLRGFRGVIARVNLSTGEIKKEKINEEWARLFIGGRGYGGKIIYGVIEKNHIPENIDEGIEAEGKMEWLEQVINSRINHG